MTPLAVDLDERRGKGIFAHHPGEQGKREAQASWSIRVPCPGGSGGFGGGSGAAAPPSAAFVSGALGALACTGVGGKDGEMLEMLTAKIP
jgi:hypothetical protein